LKWPDVRHQYRFCQTQNDQKVSKHFKPYLNQYNLLKL
jgi:hypothetical protein